MTQPLRQPEVAGFDLRHEPWLPVRTLTGGAETVSLVDVFGHADRFQGLTGETATQVFALTRLLLAVLHRSVDWDRDDPEEAWGAAWRGDVDLTADVVAHLNRHADRFDLLHPVTPFYQVAALRTARDGVSPLTSLIVDVPNNEQYFTTRAARELARIDLAEAARWVVHAQAFDVSGIKSGAVGDSRVKGGRGYPIGTGWVGNLGGLLVEGRDLRETLLLNLPLTDRDGQPWAESDAAVWERPAQDVTVRPEGSRPLGPADLLTWQSRRLRLGVQGGAVTGVVIANGDPLTQYEQGREELMTTWRRSAPQEKLLKRKPVYMPAAHDPTRTLWRGLPAMLPGTGLTTGRGDEPAQRLSSGVLQWLARMVESAGHLDPDVPLRTRAIGISYGSQSAVVSEVVDDALMVHAVLLSERGGALRGTAVLAVEAADAGAVALANLAGNLATAAGGTADGPRDRAREQAYFLLDAAFRRWLAGLGAETDPRTPHEHRVVWEHTALGTLRQVGEQLRRDAGAPAWVGREVVGRTGSRWVDSSISWEWFSDALRKALPYASPPPPTDAGTAAPTERSAG